MSKELNQHLYNIGINLSFEKKSKVKFSDIERTLITALSEAGRRRDSKLLSMLLSWAHEYAEYVIPEKLSKYCKIIEAQDSDIDLLYFNIFCIYCYKVLKIHKFKKLIIKDLNGYLTDKKKDRVAIKMNGEESFSKGYEIHIPSKTLRIRSSDIIPIDVLIKKNKQISNRLLIGANWRADIVTEIQNSDDNAYKIAKRLGCSYEPVNRILKQYRLVAG